MTLNSATTKVSYNGDGSTINFPTVFIYWQDADVRVIHRDAAGTETVWTQGTQYNLSGGNGAAGTVTVITSPTDYTLASGEKLFIKSDRAETQPDDLPLSGSLPSSVVEQMVDKAVRMIQQHSEQIARSVLLPETSSLSGLTLPEPGAGEFIRYNQAGTDLETVSAASLGVDTLIAGLADKDFLRYDSGQSAWVNRTPANVRTDLGSGATGDLLFQDATQSAARTTLGLGTAATQNTGVANGDVPAMDGTGYPAANGSQITNVTAAAVAWASITGARIRFYSFSHTSDTAITTTVPSGTPWGSAQSILVPTKGMILFFPNIRVDNASGANWNYYVGLRINGTDYFPGSDINGTLQYKQTLNSVVTGTYESAFDKVSNASYASTISHLDVETHGISTGSRTAQPIVASENGTPTSETLKGATYTCRCQVITLDMS